jgi:hypothetical protein
MKGRRYHERRIILARRTIVVRHLPQAQDDPLRKREHPTARGCERRAHLSVIDGAIDQVLPILCTAGLEREAADGGRLGNVRKVSGRRVCQVEVIDILDRVLCSPVSIWSSGANRVHTASVQSSPPLN